MGDRQDRLRQLMRRKFVAAERALQRGGQRFVARMQRERLSGPTSSESLSVRTGQLHNAINYKVRRVSALKLQLVVFVDQRVNYAKIHEFGGRIVPRKAGALAIPLAAARTKAGASRGFRPRDFADLVMLKGRGRAPILARIIRQEKKSKIIPMFALVKSVQIPPRLGFRKLFAQEGPRIIKDTQAAVRAQQ